MSRRAPGTHATLAAALLLAFGSRAGAAPSEAIAPFSVVRVSTLARDAGRPEMTVIREGDGSDRPEPFVPGRVVVKFRSDGPHAVIECAQATFERYRALADATADHSDSLDRLGRQVRVRSVRALLPERVGLSTAAARRRANDLRERLAKARPARAGLARDERPLPELFNVYVLEFDRSTDPLEVSRLFAGDAHVEYAHPDYTATVQAVPNDPYFSSTGSWGQSYDDLWGLKRISCPSAWDLSKGDGVVVAVVDTGLDMTHPDIAGNVWTNAGEIPGNGVDDDDNGYVDDVHGWSFAYGTADATDLHGHGTHVSGTIAAVGDNGVGVIGVAPRARIMPVKALNDNGSAPFSTLAVALAYAAANEADVINNSWSCSAPCPSVPVVEDAVRLAHGLGAVVVFAAGNTSTDVIQVSPQNLPESIVVSATDRYDTLTYFSSFGEIDVAAPGGGTKSGPPAASPEKNILSLKAASCSVDMCSPALIIGTQYLRQAGTSMAAPHVSGLAALVLARTPILTNEQVRQVLRTSAVDVRTPGFDTFSGYGRVNASAAVAHEPPLEALLLGPSARPIPVSDPVEVLGRVQGPGLVSWRLEYGVGTFPSTWTTIASSAIPVAGGKLADWSISARPDGEYTLRLKALGTSGASYEDRQRVLIDRVSISSPSPSRISLFRSGDTVTLRGTAALGGFQSYSLELRRPTGELVGGSGLTAANGGLLPVVDGVLGTWVVPDLQEHFSIEMTVTSSVQMVMEPVKVAADPTLHPGWPKPLGLIGTEAAHYTFGEHLDAADIDGDGRDDLLVAYGKEVRVFDHTGSLLPGWPQTVAGPGREDNITQSSIAAGDVNGDGAPEIVVATAYGRVFVWSGDGTLLPGWPRSLGYFHVAVADIDGNGVDEIVSILGVRVNVVDAGGVALPGWPVSFPGAGYIQSPAIGDVDGDGKVEVALVGNETPSNLFLLSSTGQVLPGWPVATWPDKPPGLQKSPIPALGDLDGDGDLEVVLAPGDGRVLAFHHTGAPVAGWPQAVESEHHNYPVVADLDDDGRDEVVAGVYFVGSVSVSRVHAWRGDGTALAGWPVTIDLGSGQYDGTNSQAAVADVDGDGQVEILFGTGVVYPAYSMRALRLDGTSVSLFPKPTSRGSMWATVPAVADLDGDGLLELAWIDRSAGLHVWDLQAPVSARQPWPMFGGNARHTAATVYASRPALRASAISGTTINLSWTPLSGAIGYWLDVAFDRDFTMLVAGYANKALGNVTSYSLGGLTPETTYYARVRAEWSARTSASSAPASATTSAMALGLYTLTPCRVLDTRTPDGPTGGMPLGASSRSVFAVGGACGVPSDATAVVANLTVVDATASGALKVLPGHIVSSDTSSLSIPVGRARANNAVVKLSTTGDGTIAAINGAEGTVHFILDVSGYFR